MKYYQQLSKHDPPDQYGDCHGTCIAMILGVDPACVPNYSHPKILEASGFANHHAAYEDWLSQYNLTYVACAYSPPDPESMPNSIAQLFYTFKNLISPAAVIFTFSHARLGERVDHSVVLDCGRGDVLDPSHLGGHYKGWDSSTQYVCDIKGMRPCTDDMFWLYVVSILPASLPKFAS